jgi:protein TonB
MKRPRVLALPLSFAAHGVGLAGVIVLSVAPGELPHVTAASPTADVMSIPVFPSAAPSRPPREGRPSVLPRDPARVHPAAPPVIADPLRPGAHDDLLFEDPAASGDVCIGCVPGPGAIGDAGEGPGGTPGGLPIAPVRVGGSIREPSKVRHVPPAYPEIARAARVQGTVVLECLLTPEGRVEGVRVVSGHPLLSPAAAAAVGQWLYRPTLLNGVPVPVVMTVTVTFHFR